MSASQSGVPGVGPAISNEIVRPYGGKITVENHPGGGAAWTVVLPVQGLEDRLPEATKRPVPILVSFSGERWRWVSDGSAPAGNTRRTYPFEW